MELIDDRCADPLPAVLSPLTSPWTELTTPLASARSFPILPILPSSSILRSFSLFSSAPSFDVFSLAVSSLPSLSTLLLLSPSAMLSSSAMRPASLSLSLSRFAPASVLIPALADSWLRRPRRCSRSASARDLPCERKSTVSRYSESSDLSKATSDPPLEISLRRALTSSVALRSCMVTLALSLLTPSSSVSVLSILAAALWSCFLRLLVSLTTPSGSSSSSPTSLSFSTTTSLRRERKEASNGRLCKLLRRVPVLSRNRPLRSPLPLLQPLLRLVQPLL